MKLSKHIVLVTPSFPKNNNNTIVTSALHLYATALKNSLDKNHKLSVITLHFPFTSKPYLFNNINCYPVGAANKLFPIRFWYWFKFWQKLNYLNRLQPITQIHSFWLNEPALISHFYCNWKKIPHIISLMGQDALKQNRYLSFFNHKKLKVVALSQIQANWYKTVTGYSVYATIPWGLPKSEMATTTPKKHYDFVGVGSFTTLKNYNLFIDIVEEVERKHKIITSNLLIGYGKLEKQLKERFKQKKLLSSIEFTGKLLDRNRVLNYLNQSKVLIHTSNYEGFGMVLIEALAQGCYVVSSPVGIAPQLAAKTTDCKLAASLNEFSNNCANLVLLSPKMPELLFDVQSTVCAYQDLYE